MKELIKNCAGIDVHKKTAVVCIMAGSGSKVKKQVRTFGTMSEDLRALGRWLIENNVQEVAIESTGIYWIPVYNILEVELGLKIILANARHIKNVPGRKTDVKDCEWLCKLLKNGLITPSFIPPAEIRNLRRLTRYRGDLVRELTADKNRLIKNLESCNIKLASVLSAVLGLSGRKIIHAIIQGEIDAEKLASYVEPGVKAKKSELIAALTGTVQAADIIMLRLLIEHIEALEQFITNVEQEISILAARFSKEIELLDNIPGISNNVATTIISEIGIDLGKFPTEQYLTSWVGVAPGNNESAGKNKGSRINKGNSYLKPILVQAALAAVKVKHSYFRACYQRLKARIGTNKAIIAITRRLVVCIYLIIRRQAVYYDLGIDYVDKNARERKIKYYTKKLQELNALVAKESQMPDTITA